MSPTLGQILYILLTRPPLSSIASYRFSFDLHVWSTPPAFVLSQDQTLHCQKVYVHYVLNKLIHARTSFFVVHHSLRINKFIRLQLFCFQGSIIWLSPSNLFKIFLLFDAIYISKKVLICADLSITQFLELRLALCLHRRFPLRTFPILTHQFLLSTSLFFAIYISLHLIYFRKFCFQKKFIWVFKVLYLISAYPYKRTKCKSLSLAVTWTLLSLCFVHRVPLL